MGNYIAVIVLATGLFLGMILLLAAKPKFAGPLTGTLIAIAAVGGIFFYGYGFAMTIDSFPLAVIRALLAICGMFVAKMDMSSISAAPLMQHQWAQLLFWIVHLFALYATASTAITTVGAEALRKLRLWLARWGRLNLIYGVSNESVALGKELLGQKNGAVVFIADKPDATLSAAISKAGCVLRTDDSALQADPKFIRSVGAHRKNRSITLYALQKDKADDLRYARSFLKALEQAGVASKQTSLVIRGQEDTAVTALQVLGEKYGYGFVTVFQEEQLTARLLMQKYPPCESISFDDNGKAREDFEALIIGFGQIGQAVLRNLVMNGQFQGSTFHAAVFSPDCQSVDGPFLNCFENVLEKYDITFHPYDARSRKMFEYLRAHSKSLKYVVVCTGSEKTNQEIAEGLQAFLSRMGMALPVHMCSHQGLRSLDEKGQLTKLTKLYQYDVLSTTALDKMAMILNHHYMGDYGKTPLEDWLNCDYFSRMSCRASADFLHAMLYSVGKTQEQVIKEGWQLNPAQLENLSRTEHLRWCAFHFCMGFATMSGEEYRQRSDIYRQQKEQNGKATIRIGKNMAGRTHACLVDWEELDALSQREAAVTGKNVDYKAMDTDNVLAIPELIRSHRDAEV